MIQNNKLIKKKEMWKTFEKMIDLKMFKLTTQIQVLEKQVGSIEKIFDQINAFRKKVGQESHFFENYIIDQKKENIKKKKVIYAYIFLQTNDDSQLAKYSDFKIWEFINNKVNTKDLIYIVGKRLYDLVCKEVKKSANLNQENLLFLNDYNDRIEQNFEEYSNIFENIANLSLNLYEDMFVDKITIVYSDIKNTSNLFELDVLPLNFTKNMNIYNKNQQFKKQNKNLSTSNNKLEKNIIEVLTFVIDKTLPIRFFSDLYLVNKTILKMLISFSIKYIIFIYLLNMMLRQIYTLEDNKKSIEKNIDKINQIINKQRQEQITREMISLATTLKNIKKNRKKLINKNKQEDMHD